MIQTFKSDSISSKEASMFKLLVNGLKRKMHLIFITNPNPERTTVAQLKILICDKTGIQPQYQRLKYIDKYMQDEDTLADYKNLRSGSKIMLIMRLASIDPDSKLSIESPLHCNSNLPGVIFSEPPRHETITSNGGVIDLEEEIGATITIPRNSTTTNEQLDIAVGISGSYEIPDDVEPVSPLYLFRTTNEVEFSESIDVRLQHSVNLETEEDCNNMVVMGASVTPSIQQKFQIITEPVYKFTQGIKYGLIKVKKFFSWYILGKRKNQGRKNEIFYSARLYKPLPVTGPAFTTIFCVCIHHPVHTKHCDKVIAKAYPEVSDMPKGRTVFTELIFTSEEVKLITEREQPQWNVSMDKPMIFKKEIDYPNRTDTKLEDLSDYPPRIVITLSPISTASPAVHLEAVGLDKDCLFMIDNVCLPSIDTRLLQDATGELNSVVGKNIVSENPQVEYARDMVRLMTDVEKLVHDPGSIDNLVMKVDEIQEQIKVIDTLTTNQSLTSKVSMISHQFRTVAPAMQKSSAGKPELWPGAAEVLISNSANLMKAITELQRDAEISTLQNTSMGSAAVSRSIPQNSISFSTSSSQFESKRMDDTDVNTLLKFLVQYRCKWNDIGTALNFNPFDLKNIEQSPQATTLQLRLKEVLCQWVQWPTTDHPHLPTGKALCDALRSELVGLGAEANKLIAHYNL